MHSVTRMGWALPAETTEVGSEAVAARRAAHEQAVATARVNGTLNTRAPLPSYSHLHHRRKKELMAFHRAADIEHANLLLAGRLRTVLARKQIDNMPSQASMPKSLNRRQRAEALTAIAIENARIERRLEATTGVVRTKHQLPSATERSAGEHTGIIRRHCQFPYHDPLQYKQQYYADPTNPYLNYSGGKERIVCQPADEEKSSSPARPNYRPGTALVRATIRPRSASSTVPSSNSARPRSATALRPAQPTQDPLLLAGRPISRFLPVKLEHNPIALAKHVAKMDAAAEKWRRPATATTRSTAAAVGPTSLPPAPIPAATVPTLPSLGLPVLPTAAAPLLLFSGTVVVTGRSVQVSMTECSQPWRIHIESVDAASGLEYSLPLEFQQLKPFFVSHPELFAPSDRMKTGLVSILKQSLCFVPSSNQDSDDEADDEVLELCVDLVQPAPPVARVHAPRPGSAGRRYEELKRERALALQAEQARKEPTVPTHPRTETHINPRAGGRRVVAPPAAGIDADQPNAAEAAFGQGVSVPTIANMLVAASASVAQLPPLPPSPSQSSPLTPLSHAPSPDPSQQLLSSGVEDTFVLSKPLATEAPAALAPLTTWTPAPPPPPPVDRFKLQVHTRNRISLQFAPSPALAAAAAIPPPRPVEQPRVVAEDIPLPSSDSDDSAPPSPRHEPAQSLQPVSTEAPPAADALQPHHDSLSAPMTIASDHIVAQDDVAAQQAHSRTSSAAVDLAQLPPLPSSSSSTRSNSPTSTHRSLDSLVTSEAEDVPIIAAEPAATSQPSPNLTSATSSPVIVPLILAPLAPDTLAQPDSPSSTPNEAPPVSTETEANYLAMAAEVSEASTAKAPLDEPSEDDHATALDAAAVALPVDDHSD